MSDRNQPRDARLYSISSASIGSRLAGVHGRGSDLAALVWLVILSHTPWRGPRRPTWLCNETLSNESGLPMRDLQRALARLIDAAMLSTKQGHRPGAPRPWGRILIPHIDEHAQVIIPDSEEMDALWSACFKVRKRPAALVTLVVGMHAIAAHALGRAPDDWAEVPGSTANLRRFVGASRGSTFAKRFEDLERLGIISRVDGLKLAPPSEWSGLPQGVEPRADSTKDHRWEVVDASWP